LSPYPHPIIAREGWPFVAIALAATVVLAWLGGTIGGLVGLALLAFVVQFFRDPPREIPSKPGIVLSPADGGIVVIEQVEDPYLKRPTLKISVFMNVFNVHSNRSPVDGEVKQRWYNPGAFVNAALDKASTENERNTLWIKTRDGQDVTCVQVAGLIARRILCYVKPGDRLARGQRYGFIRFGSRVDVYVPAEAAPVAAVGDVVYAAESILAEFR